MEKLDSSCNYSLIRCELRINLQRPFPASTRHPLLPLGGLIPRSSSRHRVAGLVHSGKSCGIGNLQDNPANQANLSRFRKYLRNVLRAFSGLA
jgi:hypothetical protein